MSSEQKSRDPVSPEIGYNVKTLIAPGTIFDLSAEIIPPVRDPGYHENLLLTMIDRGIQVNKLVVNDLPHSTVVRAILSEFQPRDEAEFREALEDSLSPTGLVHVVFV